MKIKIRTERRRETTAVVDMDAKKVEMEKCRPAVSGKVLGAHICQLFAGSGSGSAALQLSGLRTPAGWHRSPARTLCDKFSENFCPKRNGCG